MRSISDDETAFATRPVGRDGTVADGVVAVVVVVVIVVVVVVVVVVDEAVELEIVDVVVVVVEVVVEEVVVPQFMTAVSVVSMVMETVLGLLLPPSNQWSKEQEPYPLTESPYVWPLLRLYVAGLNPLATVTPF